MGSLEALAVYWSSVPALAVLTSFGFLGSAVAFGFRIARRRGQIRLRLVQAGTWLIVAFWSFVAASLVFCFLLADPVEYGIATAKAVAVLSISLAVGLATAVAAAISRGVPVRSEVSARGRWAAVHDSLERRVSNLAARLGLLRVRVRVVSGTPVAVAEPPDTLVVSEGLVGLLSEEQLDAVLLHELDHLAEGDGAGKAFTGVLRRVLFFDPFLFLLDRASQREREYRADRQAAKMMGGGAPLASALRVLAREWPSSGSSGLRARHPPLEERLARLRA